MEKFVVPQFIEVEDKIFGPITTRQFVILLVDGLSIFIAYKLAATIVFIVLAVILFAAGGVLAFLRVNGRPFHYFLLNILQTLRKPNLRIWQKEVTGEEIKIAMRETPPPPPKIKPKKEISESKLSELALLVNTGGAYKPEA